VIPPGALYESFENPSRDRFRKTRPAQIFSWLTPTEVKVLGTSLAMVNYRRREEIFRECELANEAHVLIAGIARITCLNANNERVTVALIAPGPIPELPLLPMGRFDSAAKPTTTAEWAPWIGRA
jgi:hypothetical protein